MTTENPQPVPVPYQYSIVRVHSHDELTAKLNSVVGEGAKPVNAYAWNTDLHNADHACLLRKLTT